MEDLKNIKITQLVDSIHTKNMQNLPTRFPNKKGILVLTPTLLKYMSLSLNKFKLGFCSDTYLPFGPNSRFLLFFFWRSSLTSLLHVWGGTTARCSMDSIKISTKKILQKLLTMKLTLIPSEQMTVHSEFMHCDDTNWSGHVKICNFLLSVSWLSDSWGKGLQLILIKEMIRM